MIDFTTCWYKNNLNYYTSTYPPAGEQAQKHHVHHHKDAHEDRHCGFEVTEDIHGFILTPQIPKKLSKYPVSFFQTQYTWEFQPSGHKL